MIDKEEYVIDPSGDKRYLLSTKVPVRNSANEVVGLVGISRDITERRKADLLRDGQAKILEMIALSEPLEEVLEHLMRLIESQLKGISGSVLLLEDEGTRLRHGAAPASRTPSQRLSTACASAPRPAHAARPPIGAKPSISLISDAIRSGRIIANLPPRMGFVHAGRRRYYRIVATSWARSRCIPKMCANGPRPRRTWSMSRHELPALRSNASLPKSAYISWPTMTPLRGFPIAPCSRTDFHRRYCMRNDTAGECRSYSSIWTTSNSSTTPWATMPATSF